MRGVWNAVRRLGRTPAFAITGIATLTLGVLAVTTVFSLLWGLVLRELPVPRPGELVQLTTTDSLGRTFDLSWRQFQEVSRHQNVFSSVIGSISQGVFTIEIGDAALRRSVTGVSGNFFAELGARPTIGRLINATDVGLPSASPERVAVLGWAFWHEQFAGNPAVLGRTLKVEGVPVTVIGVAPQGFLGLGITIEADVTVPLTLVPTISEAEASMRDGLVRWVATTGRLAPEQPLASARAQMGALWPSVLEAAAPPGLKGDSLREYLALRLEVASGARGLERGLRSRYERPLYALVAIGVLVLAGCAINLCTLMFARMESRRREFDVRLALGARRRAVIHQAGLEGAVVAVAGAAAGVALASYASPAIAAFLLHDYAVRTSLDVAPDATVAALAFVMTVTIGYGVAAAAAHIASASGSSDALRGGGRTHSRSWRPGRWLVGAQIAVSIVLLVHAGLLARTLQELTVQPGSLTSDTVLLGFPQQRVGAYRQLAADHYYQQALERVRGAPGVTAAAFTRARPQGGALPMQPVARAGSAATESDVRAEVAAVSPGFFAALGVTVLRGRDFTFADSERAPRVAAISAELERRLFGEGLGIGARIRISHNPDAQDVVVIAVVGDAPVFDVRGGNAVIAYTPALQQGALAHFKWLVARAPAGSSRDVQRAIEGLGVELVPRLQTLSYVRGRTILQERVMAGLGVAFGILALAVIAVGLYGLFSYVVSLRRREFGIRMALGAAAPRVAGTILSDGCRITAAGMACGMGCALLTTQALERVLVATSPRDPMVFLGAGALLSLVAIAAVAIPAARAARMDAVTELRSE